MLGPAVIFSSVAVRVTQGKSWAWAWGELDRLPARSTMPAAGVRGPGSCRSASRSFGPSSSPNTDENTTSKAARSSIRLTKVNLAAQYSAAGVCGAKCRSACTKLVGPLADTSTPALRRRATRAAANAARSTPRSSKGVFMGCSAPAVQQPDHQQHAKHRQRHGAVRFELPGTGELQQIDGLGLGGGGRLARPRDLTVR